MSKAESRIIGVGIAGSLAVHLLALMVFACWVAFAPAPPVMPHHEDPPVEVILPENIELVAQPPAPAPEPPQPKPKQAQPFIDNADNSPAAKAPPKADFIAARNTTAAAKAPSDKKGDAPMPTSEGIKVDTRDLTNREYKKGKLKEDRRLATPPPPPPMMAAKPQPPPPPAQKTPPPEKMAKKDDSASEKMMKELDEALQKDSKEHPSMEIRKAKPVDKLPDMKLPEEPPMLAHPTPPLPPPSPPSAAPPDPDEFAPQKRTMEVRGRISNSGPQDSVDALETAQGRYTQKVRSAIRERWQSNTLLHGDFLDPSRTTVHFVLDKHGKIKDARIIGTDGNAGVADIALTSVLEAKNPPMPEDLRRERSSDTFEMTIDFVIPAPH